MELTLEQQACNAETQKHIRRVAQYINVFIKELLKRGEEHDLSKLAEPEVQLFTEMTPRLAGCEYNSDEYKQFLKDLKPALDNHYKLNRHHPQYHINGIDGMNLVDLIEMLADWKASTERTKYGDISKSIKINAERFEIEPQLYMVLVNTLPLLETLK